MACGNIIHDLGYLASGLAFSFAQLVICDEIVSWVEAFSEGIQVSAETLALDVIAQVGPEGQYLETQHTHEHYRERWYPNLFERATYDAWSAQGGKSLDKRAAERVMQILEEHQPEPLPDAVKRRLKEIVQRSQRQSKQP